MSIVNTAYLFPFVFTDNYWSNTSNRRKYFVDFASQKRFDPLVAVNWENIRRHEMIKQVKEGQKRGIELNVKWKTR